MRQKRHACSGKQDAGRVFSEQDQSQLLLQCADALNDLFRGKREPNSGFVEILFLGDGNEAMKRLSIHEAALLGVSAGSGVFDTRQTRCV